MTWGKYYTCKLSLNILLTRVLDFRVSGFKLVENVYVLS